MSPVYTDSAATHPGSGAGGACSVTIPATVQQGDLLVVGYIALSGTGDTGGQGVIVPPDSGTGWTPFGSTQQNLANGIAWAWWKLAAPPPSGSTASADAGRTISCSYTGDTTNQKPAMAVYHFSGNDLTNPVPVYDWATSTTSSSTHVGPTVNTTGYGNCLIATLELLKDTGPGNTFSVPSPWEVDNANAYTGGSGSAPSMVLVDSGAAVSPGANQGGEVITATVAAGESWGLTFAVAPLATAQTARPNTDVTTTGWTPSTPSTPECALLADQNDATYLASSVAPASQVLEVGLPVMNAPPNTVTCRFQTAGNASTCTVETELRQGASTSIASRTDTYSTPPVTPVTVTLMLTETQKQAITNLTALRIRITVSAS